MAEALVVGGRLALVRRTLPPRRHESVDPRSRKDRPAYGMRAAAERASKGPTDDETEDRHPPLEDPEHDRDLNPQFRVDPGEADPDGGGEVVESDRQRHEQEREHRATVVGQTDGDRGLRTEGVARR